MRALTAVSLLLAMPVMAAEAPLSERLDEVRKTLVAGDIAKTAGLAEALTKAEPNLKEAWEVLAACKLVLTGSVPSDVQLRLAWKPPVVKVPAAGETWFVAATSLRLRGRGDANAPVVAGASINTPVEVKSVKGDWAEVSATVQPAVLSFVNAGPRAPTLGWNQWRFLSPARLTKADLMRDAAVLEKQGFLPEAVRLLERAAAIAPGDADLIAELKRLAVATHQFELVARLAPPTQGKELTAVATAFAACRGNLELASEVDGSLPLPKLEKAPANACVVLENPSGFCAPREPFAGAPFDAKGACDSEFRGSQSLSACRAKVAEQLAQHDREMSRWRAASDKVAERIGALRGIYSGGSAVRFDLTLPASEGPRRLFAYRIPYRAAACQSSDVTYDWAKTEISASGIDAPLNAGPFTVWIQVPSPVSAIVGLVFAGDAKEAKEKALSLREKANPWDPKAASLAAPQPNIALPTPICECGASPGYEW